MLRRLPPVRQQAGLDGPARAPGGRPDADDARFSGDVDRITFAPGFRPGLRVVRLD